MLSQKCPIGIGEDNFNKMRENNFFYIDKSLLIKDIVTSGTEVTLITRPRRFGKTLNMSMLQNFLDCNIKNSAPLFRGLNIEKEIDICSKFMNKCPVFFISFKNLSCKNMDIFYDDFAKRIALEFQNYRYLLDSPKTSPEQKIWFSTLLSGNAKPGELKISLLLLTKLLYQHHGSKSWLLIDEYDAPIHSAFQNNQYDECIDFMRDIYGNALKGNESLHKAVLTGILRVSKESIFSGLNNLNVFSVVQEKFSHYFGITEEELKRTLVIFELEAPLAQLKYWYNGYCFGESKSLYNPWSILKWLDDSTHEFQPHWLNTSSNDLVRSLFFIHKDKFEGEVSNLLSGHDVKIKIQETTHFPNLKHNCSKDDYFSLLLNSGYLTIQNKEIYQEEIIYTLCIPNREIRSIFKSMMEDWLKQFAPNLSSSTSMDIAKALEVGDTKTFQKQFSDVVLEVMSYHDFAKQPENAFHCFTVGFLSWLSYAFDVKSNRETGEGRADICLIPKNSAMPGYVFELKAYKPKRKVRTIPTATITRQLNTALKQIEETKYTAIFKSNKVKKVFKIALVFYGKKVWMKVGD